MRKKTVLELFNKEIAKNNKKYELELVKKAVREHKDIAEGFGPSGEPDYKYYAFDWDDNIVKMPTEILLVDVNGDEVGMSTDDFAEYRELIGKEEFKYKGKVVKGFSDDSFKNFRYPTGDEKFLEDVLSAPAAPSWGDFVECINGGSIFAIITARGHHPETLKKAVKIYINANYMGISKKLLVESLDKYRMLASTSENADDNTKIDEYLDLCKFYPVSFGAGSAANPEKAKVKALREFIAYTRALNKDLPVEVGFSDDDPGNIDTMEKHFSEEPGLTLKYTGVLPRNEEIEEQTEPFQRKVRAKHRKMKVRLIGKGNKKAAKQGAPFNQNPDYNRSLSAPAAFGGLEEEEKLDEIGPWAPDWLGGRKWWAKKAAELDGKKPEKKKGGKWAYRPPPEKKKQAGSSKKTTVDRKIPSASVTPAKKRSSVKPKAVPSSALKALPVGKVNLALNQLRNRGNLSAKTIAAQIQKTIDNISKTAGPQQRNFLERDVPVINQIKDELVKILSGDFSGLKEAKDETMLVHPVTYEIFDRLSKKK